MICLVAKLNELYKETAAPTGKTISGATKFDDPETKNLLDK